MQVESSNDQIVLYRGVAYVEAGGGSGELRLTTSIGRARVKRGKMIFLYSPETDSTQLITLETSSTLENKFEPERRVEIQAGESSELNFKHLRVIPLLPTSVAGPSLKIVLEQLEVPDSDKKQAIRIAIARHEKKFAILRKEDAPDRSEELSAEQNQGGARGLASVDNQKKKVREIQAQINRPYLRHVPDSESPRLESKMISRITGGASSGRELVNPGVGRSRGRGLASEAKGSELLPAEEAAKKKLLHVLSGITIE